MPLLHDKYPGIINTICLLEIDETAVTTIYPHVIKARIGLAFLTVTVNLLTYAPYKYITKNHNKFASKTFPLQLVL